MADINVQTKMREIEFIMVYDLNKNDLSRLNRLRMFGKEFVENNQVNEEIQITLDMTENGRKEKLREYLELKNLSEEYISKNLINVKLKGVNYDINFSNMFCECHSLISVTTILSSVNIFDRLRNI